MGKGTGKVRSPATRSLINQPWRNFCATALGRGSQRGEWTRRSLGAALTAGEGEADRAFDAVYPAAIRERSGQYWTPVHVARRAAALLVCDDSFRVLDVGSGAGKFCIIGALTSRATFVGIEHRPALVDVARNAANRCRAGRATFVHGTIDAVEWRDFDAYYFFNPFEESAYLDHYDCTVDLSASRRARDLEFVFAALAAEPPGVRVVTYHGLGCAMPPSFTCLRTEPAGSDALELWIRRG